MEPLSGCDQRRSAPKLIEENAMPQVVFSLLKKGIRVYHSEGLVSLLKSTNRFATQRLRRFGDRMFKNYDGYRQWISVNEKYDFTEVEEEIDSFAYKPLISIITPVFNTDPMWLSMLLKSVMSQWYENWELVLCDDGSTNPATLSFLRDQISQDKRIKVLIGSTGKGISAATNEALQSSSGDFVALVDHDDELAAFAMYEVVKTLNDHPDTDIIYSDEDKIAGKANVRGMRHDPFFKPDWDPILLLGTMYIGHLTVYRRKLLDALGPFRSEFDFSQDLDMVLRATEFTNRIRHIPKVLYHWRVLPGSASVGGRPSARASNIAATRAALERRGIEAKVSEDPLCNRIRMRIDNKPMVSIIIPTDDQHTVMDCLQSLFGVTQYPSVEIIVVTNSALAETIRASYPDDPTVRVSGFDKPFNFSEKCNQGATEARGEYLLFLNDDVRPTHASWIEEMLAMFGHRDVGGVSPMMCYADGSIQYAGMVTGVRGGVTTIFHGIPSDSSTYFSLGQTPRSVSVLSGACLLMKKDVFSDVGGFDADNTPTMDSDLDLSFKLLDRGYRLVYQPFAKLTHLGHVSIDKIESTERHQQEVKRTKMFMLKRWGHRLAKDDYCPLHMRRLLLENGHPEYSLIADRQEDRYLKAPNVLVINHELTLTGAPLLTYNVARHLRQEGYFVATVSRCSGPCGSLYAESDIPLMVDSSLWHEKSLPRQTEEFIRGFDLVIVSTAVLWRLVQTLKGWNVPVVWFVHENTSMIQGFLPSDYDDVFRTFSLADDIVIYGKQTAKSYRESNIEGNFHRLQLAAQPLVAAKSPSKSADLFRIVQVGTVERRKGQDLLIKAVNRLPDDYSKRIALTFIGRLLYEDYADALRRLNRRNDNTTFLGEISREDIGEHFNASDLFVCCSRDETGPLVVAEAMSLGLPVISTRVGSVPEMIVHGESGILIDIDDAGALSEAIMKLVDNREECLRLGRNAKKRFNEALSMDVLTRRFADIVRQRVSTQPGSVGL